MDLTDDEFQQLTQLRLVARADRANTMERELRWVGGGLNLNLSLNLNRSRSGSVQLVCVGLTHEHGMPRGRRPRE